jgi:hypothetical protein
LLSLPRRVRNLIAPSPIVSVSPMLRVFAIPTIRLTVERGESEEMLDKVQCSLVGCHRPNYCRSFCIAHYKRLYRNGFVGSASVRKIKKPNEVRLCDVEGCSKAYFASGMCTTHYGRDTRRRDNEYKTRQILLTRLRTEEILRKAGYHVPTP